MTISDRERAIELLNAKKAPGHICAYCKTNANRTIGNIVETRNFNEGHLIYGAPTTPLAVLFCDNCGHAQFFNAIILGLIDRDTGKVNFEG